MTAFFADPHGEHWLRLRPWIKDACTHSDGWWTIEALDTLLRDGAALLWVLRDNETPIAGVVTQIEDWDGERVAVIVSTGGSGVIDALADHLPTLEAWARASGATQMLFRGRRGWAKPYRKLGYEEIAITMRKAL